MSARILADANIAAQMVTQLRALGHDVLYAAEVDGRMDDESWLRQATEENRLLLTDDKDFGELVFRKRLISGSVVLLRLHKMALKEKLEWLQERWDLILGQPAGSFTVVTEQKMRVRLRPT